MEPIKKLVEEKNKEMERLIEKYYFDDPEARKALKYAYYLGVSIGMSIK